MNTHKVNDKQNKKRQKQAAQHANVLESLKGIGGNATSSIKEDLIKKTPQSVIEQLFGQPMPTKFSGEINPGGSLEIKDVFSGQHVEKQKIQKQMHFERRLMQEEKIQVGKKTNELRIQLQALMQEVVTLSETTTDLGNETKIAAMQAPVEPGVYHLIFFEKLIGFIKSFRKKIEKASVWLHASNTRAQKKNVWGQRYKKYGAKFLLSGEHYLTRSAG